MFGGEVYDGVGGDSKYEVRMTAVDMTGDEYIELLGILSDPDQWRSVMSQALAYTAVKWAGVLSHQSVVIKMGGGGV